MTKRKNYFDFLPVKDRFQFQTLHTDKGIRLDLAPAMSLDFGRYSCTSSNVISSLMDPVYEVKEESNQPEINGALLQSPRINCFTDNMEDSLTNNISPKTSYYSTFPYHLSKNYSMDSEAIAEDNNENIVEKEVQIKKKDSRHKFETFVDKEENVMFSNPFSEKDADFETINEEVLEEEILIHQKLNNLGNGLYFISSPMC